MNRLGNSEGAITEGESDSLLNELIRKKDKKEVADTNRRETIKLFLEENPWQETNSWRDQINDAYERIDWSLLYRIDRDSELVKQGVETTHTGENINERLALSLEMREKLIEIYKALQSREISSNNKESDHQRWLEKFKGLLGSGTIKSFNLEIFFETPKERRKRERQEKRETGTDFRERILSELREMNFVRLNFPWQRVPEEILTNIGKEILAICGLKVQAEKKIVSKEK